MRCREDKKRRVRRMEGGGDGGRFLTRGSFTPGTPICLTVREEEEEEQKVEEEGDG